MDFESKAMTITFGDQAENHVGMQKIGVQAAKGLSVLDLKTAKAELEVQGAECKLIELNPKENGEYMEAAVLVIKNGVNFFIGPFQNSDDLFMEHLKLDVDKKAKMYGRIVNKHARHNLCFSNHGQEPDYDKGNGRIVAFQDVKLTHKLRNLFPIYFGADTRDLCAEGNYYFDVNKCGIGWHGDSERKIVIAVRLGESIPLKYHWFKNNQPVGKTINIELEHGDIYIMSEKAVGSDWKKKKYLYTSSCCWL